MSCSCPEAGLDSMCPEHGQTAGDIRESHVPPERSGWRGRERDGDKVVSVLFAAADVYTPEGVGVWLFGHNGLLDGQRPVDLLSTEEGLDRLLGLVDAMASGAYA